MLAKKVDERQGTGAASTHLPIVAVATHERRRRWAVVGLACTAAALYAAAFFAPWWHITLFAPQYPKGLRLSVGLTGFGGDVHEIDLLNHYIGMGHLADAAPLERQLAGYGIVAVAIVVVTVLLVADKRLGGLALVPALLLPLGFLADSYYWMYRFGHELNPRAPIRMPPFTPQLFGSGVIGQFRTLAVPHIGFLLAVVALAALVTAVILRRRVCHTCPARSTCALMCPHLMVLRAPR